MEPCTETRSDKRIPDSRVKECLEEYKLQDKVDALKSVLGIKHDSFDSTERDRSVKPRKGKFDTTGVNDCLRPPVPSALQVLLSELRDAGRSGYWNKEIGKTVYLGPHLPAGCDPLETTFGKATIRQEHGVAEILNPGNDVIAHTDERAHELYRKSHNDYDPSERVDRKYDPPFDRLSAFGAEKKRPDFSGRKAAACLQWINSDPMTLVSRRLADFSNRTRSRLGKVRNRGTSRAPEDFTFGQNSEKDFEVADVLRESSASTGEYDIYCSVYADEISRHCGSSWEKTVAAGLRSDRSDLSRSMVPASATKFEAENLGDQTSVQALISPNVFTQLGLSHLEFFKTAEKKGLSLRLPILQGKTIFFSSVNCGLETGFNAVFVTGGGFCITFMIRYVVVHTKGQYVLSGQHCVVCVGISPRSCKEMRSIFENIGVEFPDNSFDVIWTEGLKKDRTGGVCVETFRNILGRLAMHSYTNDQG